MQRCAARVLPTTRRLMTRVVATRTVASRAAPAAIRPSFGALLPSKAHRALCTSALHPEMEELNEEFAEARYALADAEESVGTTYFADDLEDALSPPDSRLRSPRRSQASVRPGVAAPQEHAPASYFTTVPSHRPAIAVDATSARLLDGVEAGLRRRRGVVPVAACARPGGRVSSLAWRETRTISPRRDHEDAARRRAAASNS